VSLLLMTALLAAVGCAPSMDQLDLRAAVLLEQRQRAALGLGAVDAAEVIPDASAAPLRRLLGGAVVDPWDTSPPTLNPPPDELPATTAPPDPTPAEQRALPDVANDAPPGTGEDAAVLDLEAVLGYAIANGPTYRDQKEELFLTVLSLIIERHLWGPRFFSTITGQVAGTPESGDNDQVLSLIGDIGVTQRLPYGGQVAAAAVADYTSFLQSAATPEPDDTSVTSLELSIDLPLLRGAGRVARDDLIQAERDVVYAARGFERFRREYLVEVANRYFDLLRQRQTIENQREQLRSLERLAERFSALVRAGRQPAFQAERSVQQVLFGRSNLLRRQQQYQTQLDRFKLLIGMPTTQTLVIEPSVIAVPEPQLDPGAAVATALSLRLDLQTDADRLADRQRDVAVAANNTLPDLDLFADVNLRTDRGRDIGGVDFEPGDSTYRAGATLGLPLDRTIEAARLRSAQTLLAREVRRYERRRDEVALQVRDAVRDIRQSRYNLELQERNVELARRRTQGVRLREQSLGPREVIEAQEDLLEALDRRDQAASDLRQSVLQYLLQTGQMRVGPDGQWRAPAGLVPPDDAPGVNDMLEADVEVPPEVPPADGVFEVDQ
jgi:outer membrane protein